MVTEVVTICKNLELEYGIFGPLSSTEAKPFEVRQQDFNKTSESEEGIESKEKGERVVETNSLCHGESSNKLQEGAECQ